MNAPFNYRIDVGFPFTTNKGIKINPVVIPERMETI